MGSVSRRALMLGAGSAFIASGLKSQGARSPIRLGVLTDFSGPFADIAGNGSVAAVRLAIEDFKKTNTDVPVEVVSADFQLKPDVAVNIVRAWFDQGGVDAVLDVPSSSAALAISNLVRQKDKIALFSGAVTTDLTGSACSPNHVQWMSDSYAVSAAGTRAMVKEGGNRWFFIAVNYAMGEALVRDASESVTAAGAKIVGSVKYPFGNGDFASFILQAKASGANAIGLATSGDDLVNLIKQLGDFGMREDGGKIAAYGAELPVISSIGLGAAQGLYASNSFYWDRNDASRDFSRRLAPQIRGGLPSSLHACAYSATYHYLKVVADLGLERAKTSGALTVARMKELPTDDPLFGVGTIRDDGRKLHPMYLLQAKKASQPRYAGDLMHVVSKIPANEAFRPMSPACSMAR